MLPTGHLPAELHEDVHLPTRMLQALVLRHERQRRLRSQVWTGPGELRTSSRDLRRALRSGPGDLCRSRSGGVRTGPGHLRCTGCGGLRASTGDLRRTGACQVLCTGSCAGEVLRHGLPHGLQHRLQLGLWQLLPEAVLR